MPFVWALQIVYMVMVQGGVFFFFFFFFWGICGGSFVLTPENCSSTWVTLA